MSFPISKHKKAPGESQPIKDGLNLWFFLGHLVTKRRRSHTLVHTYPYNCTHAHPTPMPKNWVWRSHHRGLAVDINAFFDVPFDPSLHNFFFDLSSYHTSLKETFRKKIKDSFLCVRYFKIAQLLIYFISQPYAHIYAIRVTCIYIFQKLGWQLINITKHEVMFPLCPYVCY